MHEIKVRHLGDPTINMLARRLGSVVWKTELDEGELEACFSIETDPGTPRRLITLMRDYKTFCVRAYLAGAQRTFGYFKPTDKTGLAPAIRYADMVRMYFWKYKTREAFEPDDGQLNISAERAKSDLLFEPEALQLLKDFEAHFIKIGAIVAPEERERMLQQQLARGRAKATITSMVADTGEVLQTAILRMEGNLELQTKEIARLISMVAGLHPAAATVRAMNEPLPFVPGRPLPLQDPQVPWAGDPLPSQPITICASDSPAPLA